MGEYEQLSIELEALKGNFTELEISHETLRINSDVAFLYLSGAIVIFLQAGFAFLECGVVRSKNTTNILLQSLMDLFISGAAFWLIGYAFAYGTANKFIGATKFASHDVGDEEMATWFFQYTFAATAATIINGAVAERCNFFAYTIYSFVISGFLYPVLAHWAWTDEGWLKVGDGKYHYLDFAGSGIVHLCGGTCSFVACAMLGPRIGRFDPLTGKANDIKGHSLPLAALGGFILIFGILAFNGGSQGHISSPGDGAAVAITISNTIISGSFGGITTLILHKSGIFGTPRQWSFLFSLNGSLVAMVATCAGADRFYPWGAAVIGIVAAPLFFALRAILLALKIDDPLDAAPVHIGGGAWGVIACSIFARDRSVIYESGNGRGMWLAWNIVGMLAIIAWSAGVSIIMFGTMRYFKIFRASAEVEQKGLDAVKHGEIAYPVSGWKEEQYSCYTVDNEINANGERRINHGVHPNMLQHSKINYGYQHDIKSGDSSMPDHGFRYQLGHGTSNNAVIVNQNSFIPDSTTTTF